MSYNWKKVLLKPDQPIIDALTLIDKESLRIGLVVDNNMNLLGVVTDGDIRRALLKSISIENHVSTIMNSSPFTIQLGASRKEILKLMEREKILAVPVMHDKKIVGLETLQKTKKELSYKNPVFLMAGGFGARLRPLTDNCPKPMIKVGDKPLLEITLNNFIQSGFTNFYISTHYMPEMIMNYFGDGSKWNIDIKYIHEDAPLGTGGALGLLPGDINELPLLLVNGDLLTNIDFVKVLEFHNKNYAEATMCVRDYEYQIPYGVINGDGTRILSMDEKPINNVFVNAGIYVINPNIYKSVTQNTKIDMPSLLKQFIDKDSHIMMFPIHEYWLDIGRHEDLKKAQVDILNMEFFN